MRMPALASAGASRAVGHARAVVRGAVVVTALVYFKLLALMATIALGWCAMRRGWLVPKGTPGEPLLAWSNGLIYLFVPALMFRTMVRQDLSALPLHMLLAYLIPAWLLMLAVYGVCRHRFGARPTAEAGTRALPAVYGNGVQVGVPLVTALYGEAGLALHIALVSLHGVLLLSTLTVLVEADLARGRAGVSRSQAFFSTVRNAVIHPVVLPVVLGLCWNLTGFGLHVAVDTLLYGLGLAVVPLSLILIGATLAEPRP
jgi:malonate transporter and related proteins